MRKLTLQNDFINTFWPDAAGLPMQLAGSPFRLSDFVPFTVPIGVGVLSQPLVLSQCCCFH